MTEEEKLELYKKLTKREKIWLRQMEWIVKLVYILVFFTLGAASILYYINYKVETEGIFYSKNWNCMQELEEDVE